MTLEDYFDSVRIGKKSRRDFNKRNFILSKIEYLQKIGIFSIDEKLDICECLGNGDFRIIENYNDITLAIHEVSSSNNFYSDIFNRIKANKFLYSILKVQAHFNDFDQLLPHTINMLSSLYYLDFHYFSFFHISHWRDDTNEMASYVLPYQIACGDVEHVDFYTRLRAKIEGYSILKYYYYESDITNNASCAKDYLDALLFGEDDLKSIMEFILRQIYQNVDSIIHCDDSSYIMNIYLKANEKLFGSNDKYNYMIFPELSLIYACSLMGENDLSILFDLNLEMLKKHTVGVYEDYYSVINND